MLNARFVNSIFGAVCVRWDLHPIGGFYVEIMESGRIRGYSGCDPVAA